jgi:hypothetical protein
MYYQEGFEKKIEHTVQNRVSIGFLCWSVNRLVRDEKGNNEVVLYNFWEFLFDEFLEQYIDKHIYTALRATARKG